MTQGGKKIRAAVGDLPPSAFAPLRPLLQPHEQDAGEGLRKLAAALGGLDSHVRLHVQLVDGEAVENWSIEGGTGKAFAKQHAPKQADVRLVLRRTTWLAIAHGRLSPFDALFAGRMRFGGNSELGKLVARHLSDPSVPFVPPC
jgi:putative sterol carrier protein